MKQLHFDFVTDKEVEKIELHARRKKEYERGEQQDLEEIRELSAFEDAGWYIAYDDESEDPEDFVISNLFGQEWREKDLVNILETMTPSKLSPLNNAQIGALEALRFWYLTAFGPNLPLSDDGPTNFYDFTIKGYSLNLLYERLNGFPYIV